MKNYILLVLVLSIFTTPTVRSNGTLVMQMANAITAATTNNTLDRESSLNLDSNEIKEVNKIKKTPLPINECQKIAQQIRIGMIKLCAQKKAVYPWSEENVFGVSGGAIFNKVERICKYGLKHLNTDEPAPANPAVTPIPADPTINTPAPTAAAAA